ncbi:hypothetical protein GCM10012319_69800 [Comamonas sp. KCTC 72670]|nr:hypothetical protein GCM10012319_69800 [Comamonas sp. KCTC 72670]
MAAWNTSSSSPEIVSVQWVSLGAFRQSIVLRDMVMAPPPAEMTTTAQHHKGWAGSQGPAAAPMTSVLSAR